MKTITKQVIAEISIDGQNAVASAYVRIADQKVWLNIRSNAYREQCHAVARVWVPAALKWNLLYEIPPASMSTSHGLCYRAHSSVKQPLFQLDLDRLRDGAAAILGD